MFYIGCFFLWVVTIAVIEDLKYASRGSSMDLEPGGALTVVIVLAVLGTAIIMKY